MEVSKVTRSNNKVIAGGIAGALIIGIIAFMMIGSAVANSREELVGSLKQAIREKDVDAFLSHLSKEARSYPQAKEGTMTFLEAAQPKTDILVDAMDLENLSLSREAQKLRNEPLPYQIVKGKKWIFFDHYSVGHRSYKIKLEGVDQEVSLTLNGQPVPLSTFEQPFLFGSYQLAASKKHPWTTVTDEEKVQFDDDGVETASFNLEGKTINISKEFKDAEILFKGQPTGVKVGDERAAKFGPIGDGEEKNIQLRLKLPWVEGDSLPYKENPRVFGGPTHRDFVFKIDGKEGNAFFQKFLKEFGVASMQQSTQPFTTATEKYVLKKQTEYTSNESRYSYNRGIPLKSYYNKETTSLISDSEKNPQLVINGLALLQQSSFRPGDQHADTPEEKLYKVTVKALYDKDKQAWKVDDFELGSVTLSALPNKNQEEQYIIMDIK